MIMTHSLFLLKPFIDCSTVVPLAKKQYTLEKVFSLGPNCPIIALLCSLFHQVRPQLYGDVRTTACFEVSYQDIDYLFSSENIFVLKLIAVNSLWISCCFVFGTDCWSYT